MWYICYLLVRFLRLFRIAAMPSLGFRFVLLLNRTMPAAAAAAVFFFSSTLPCNHRCAVVVVVVAVGRFLKGMSMSKTRAPPSGANPSNLVEKRIDNEDDVLHVQVCRCNLHQRQQQ